MILSFFKSNRIESTRTEPFDAVRGKAKNRGEIKLKIEAHHFAFEVRVAAVKAVKSGSLASDFPKHGRTAPHF